jgi:hypothetical protein
MEERQFCDITEMDNFLKEFDQLDENDFLKMQRCINWLMFRRGIVDGTYEPETTMYYYIVSHNELISRYLKVAGLRLRVDTENMQVWFDELPEDEGGGYSPFTASRMNGNHIILLSVLQKRLATRASSKDIGLEFPNGVYLTEQDILQDMSYYMESRTDEKRRYLDAKAAINTFSKDLGILRVVLDNVRLPDGTECPVYKVSPFIEHQFDVDKVEDLLKKVNMMMDEPEEDEVNG